MMPRSRPARAVCSVGCSRHGAFGGRDAFRRRPCSRTRVGNGTGDRAEPDVTRRVEQSFTPENEMGRLAVAAVVAVAGIWALSRWARRAAPGADGGAGTRERPHGGVEGWIRTAGPESMAAPPSDWDAVDEASDESFPASDPTSHSPPRTGT